MSTPNNYIEETKPLFRLLRTPAFRFVLVRYNHHSLLQQLKQELKNRFSHRAIVEVDAEKVHYRQLLDQYYQLEKGFFIIHNFRAILKNSDLYAGLNQRRDKLARYPIAIIAFIEPPSSEKYAREVMEKMPDLWSYRSMLLDLKKAIERKAIEKPSSNFITISSLGGATKKEKEEELNRLLKIHRETDPKEVALLNNQYEQIVAIQKDLGLYREALLMIEKWLKIAELADKVNVLIEKGAIFTTIGQLDQALETFQEAKVLAKEEDKYSLARVLERLGSTHSDLGQLDKALLFFEDYHQLSQELYEAFPQNVSFKNGLAIAYEKLGETHSALGQLDKALLFFEKDAQLSQELYEAFPQNVSFKNGLAIAYGKLGETHSALGQLDKALIFFEDCHQLFEELYEAFPQNVSFKNGLAIAYAKLGDTHSALGQLDKALLFFEQRSQLGKELYEAFPQNVSFKNGLAIAYERLGSTHSALGQLDKALLFFEQRSQLGKELYEAFPQNVSFKNGLAQSYQWLGWTYEKLKNKKKAKEAYLSSEKLLIELVSSSPQYVKFKRNLKWVQDRLKIKNKR